MKDVDGCMWCFRKETEGGFGGEKRRKKREKEGGKGRLTFVVGGTSGWLGTVGGRVNSNAQQWLGSQGGVCAWRGKLRF